MTDLTIREGGMSTKTKVLIGVGAGVGTVALITVLYFALRKKSRRLGSPKRKSLGCGCGA